MTVDHTSSCERHVTVVIPRADINRYFEVEFDELTPKAEIPGFRPGKAPRKLVVSRFKEHIADQVKGKLLVDCLAQVNEDHKFSAISEPDLKLDVVVLPDEGDMTFEFNLEVRPEFDMPEWKGLTPPAASAGNHRGRCRSASAADSEVVTASSSNTTDPRKTTITSRST